MKAKTAVWLVGAVAIAVPIGVLVDHWDHWLGGGDATGAPAAPFESTDVGNQSIDWPATMPLVNDTVNASLPGGDGLREFIVDGPYVQLLVVVDVAAWTGEVDLWLTGPDGIRHSLVVAMHWDPDDCGACLWRVPAAPGRWQLGWDVNGQADWRMHVTAQ